MAGMAEIYLLAIGFAAFILMIIICTVRGKRKFKKAMDELEKYYYGGERDRLLSEKFSDMSYEIIPPEEMRKDRCKKYSAVLKKDSGDKIVSMRHSISERVIHENYDGTDSRSYVYNNLLSFSAEFTSGRQILLSGSFSTSMITLSIIKGVEKIAEFIAKKKHEEYVMEDYYNQKMSDEIIFKSGGKLCCKNMPAQQRQALIDSGFVSETEKLICMWKNFAGISVCYSDGKVSAYISDRTDDELKQPYLCLQKDFVMENAELIEKTFVLLSLMADKLAQVSCYF